MASIGRTGIKFITTVLVICFALTHPVRAPAQSPANEQTFDRTKPRDRSDTITADGTSSVTVTSKDASGTLDGELPLDINIVRSQSASVESIRLLGLPQGVTVSDYRNTFTSLVDNTDADVTSWELSKLHILQNSRRDNSFSLAVAVIWAPDSGGRVDVASSILNVRFMADVGASERITDGSRTIGKEVTQKNKEDPSVRSSAELPAPAPKSPAAEVADIRRPGNTSSIDRKTGPPIPDRPDAPPGTGGEASLPRQSGTHSPTNADPLVERAKNLIRLGDISGARLLLERARARNAPNATFLLAQTWDPEMLRAWKVRGMRADPDLARSLYAKAAEQGQTDERLLAATRP